MPAYVSGIAGAEINRGRYVDVLESTMVHPVQSDGLVNKGDPVYWETLNGVGNIGIALDSAVAATDFIAVQTFGAWQLTLDSDNGSVDAAAGLGDPVYLSTTGVLSQDPAGTYFGRTLLAKTGSATPSVVPINVGFGSRRAWGQELSEVLTATGAMNPFGVSDVDGASAAQTLTLGSGTFVGQRKRIIMSTLTNAIDVSVTNHSTSDPEIFTFGAVDDYLELIWTGTEWTTLLNLNVALP